MMIGNNGYHQNAIGGEMNKIISSILSRLIPFLYLGGLVGIFYIGFHMEKFTGRNPSVEKSNVRVYESPYMGKIEEKYPNIYKKREEYRQIILKSIVSQTESIEGEKKNIRVINYYDKAGRLVYKITEDIISFQKATQGARGSSGKKFELFTPDEEGYIYDEKGAVIKKVKAVGGMPYTVMVLDEENRKNFLKTGNGRVTCIDIVYESSSKRKEVEEYINGHPYFQYYKKTERFYENDVLYKETEFQDQEMDDSFIMATIEKKYNAKGELIYKTVERKDKTNDYKSFTEMDFVKDEIVTKYYKGKDVFATVTENLVGPVETIEETETVRGEEIKRVYKNKVKVIVKRQKVGEPIKIVDIQTYDRKKSLMRFERNIFDDDGNLKYKYTGVKAWKDSYLYDRANHYSFTMKEGYLHESFYGTSFELNEWYNYLGDFRLVEKFDINSNKVIEFEHILEIELKECNLEFGNIEDKNMKIKNTREMKKYEKMTLEELLNGYKYE